MKHMFTSLPSSTEKHLLENPTGERSLVLNDALREPAGGIRRSTLCNRHCAANVKYSQFDLLLGILDRVGSMADVATDSKRIVATDSAFFLKFNARRMLAFNTRKQT